MRIARRLLCTTLPSTPMPGILYPGSGIFFWWQAGATQALATKFDLSRAQFAGASGGSLAATLAACGCDSGRAFDVAWRLTTDSGAWDKGAWGLFGIWGGLVRTWLDEILPADAHEQCSGRVNVLVREPFSPAICVNSYSSRDDLISACLASVHVPLFMDGRLTASFRGRPHIDDDWMGMGRAQPALVLPKAAGSVRMSVGRDPRIRKLTSSPGGTMRLLSRDAIEEVIDFGHRHVLESDKEGAFAQLEALRMR